MPFEKGNKLREGTTNPNAGRRPSVKTQARRWEEENPNAVSKLMDMLMARAEGRYEVTCPHCHKGFKDPVIGDSECARYLIDQIRGKARAKTELEITRGEGMLTGDEVTGLFTMIDARKNEMLAQFFTLRFGERENWPEYAQQGIKALQENWEIETVEPPAIQIAPSNP